LARNCPSLTAAIGVTAYLWVGGGLFFAYLGIALTHRLVDVISEELTMSLAEEAKDYYLSNCHNCIESAKYQIKLGNVDFALQFLESAQKSLAAVRGAAPQPTISNR
jgi:hypothetical protein